VPTTLPQLLQSDYLHAPPPLGSPLANPTTRCSPAHIRPSLQQATSSAHCRRSKAPANSASCRRCTQRTAEVQRRQLRHPQETRCQRRCPIISDPIVCTHRSPSARPSQAQPPATAPPPTASACITHHRCTLLAFASIHPQRQLPPMSRSVPLRSSEISCVIRTRLGPSDAAPAGPI
jgi:hypothetical protein